MCRSVGPPRHYSTVAYNGRWGSSTRSNLIRHISSSHCSDLKHCPQLPTDLGQVHVASSASSVSSPSSVLSPSSVSSVPSHRPQAFLQFASIQGTYVCSQYPAFSQELQLTSPERFTQSGPVPVVPPPQTQHIVLALKSASSYPPHH